MSDVLDYAIIGAGVAGAYTAWRLAASYEQGELPECEYPGTPLGIALFDTDARIGGRLLTVRVPGTNHRAELGGMRYTTGQRLIRGVVGQIPELTEDEFDYPQRLMFLRGRRFAPGNTGGVGRDFPYLLDRGEPGDPGDLVRLAIIRALRPSEMSFDESVPQLAVREILSITERLPTEPVAQEAIHSFTKEVFTVAQWRWIKHGAVIRNRRLYELGFWNLLQHYLSSEGFLYAHDALGYESVLANWNAADAIPWFLADFGVTYKTVRGGMDQIPTQLVLEADAICEGVFRKQETLRAIERIEVDGRKAFRLVFDTGLQLARRVILALPKEALKRIDLPTHSSEDKKRLAVLLDSVTAHPLFKLFLAYDNAWWERDDVLGERSGRSTTDLPIRQVYYFEPCGHPDAAAGATGGPGVVMASYSDEHYVDFWKPLQKLPGEPGYGASAREPDNLDAGTLQRFREDQLALEVFGVLKPMVEKAHRQIVRVHTGEEIDVPLPYVGLVKDWTQPPFCGGWHAWNPRAKSWEVIRELVQPFGEDGLYICGEAYSSEQGWVEGALKSAELVLQRVGLRPPPWIPGAEYNEYIWT